MKYLRNLAERKELEKKGVDGKKWKDTISIYVLTSTFLLFLNPPCHAVAVIHTPCSPCFVSSLYYPCRTVTENESTFLGKLPFILAENLVVTNFLFAWTFSWINIFLGLAWIREEVRKLR